MQQDEEQQQMPEESAINAKQFADLEKQRELQARLADNLSSIVYNIDGAKENSVATLIETKQFLLKYKDEAPKIVQPCVLRISWAIKALLDEDNQGDEAQILDHAADLVMETYGKLGFLIPLKEMKEEWKVNATNRLQIGDKLSDKDVKKILGLKKKLTSSATSSMSS